MILDATFRDYSRVRTYRFFTLELDNKLLLYVKTNKCEQELVKEFEIGESERFHIFEYMRSLGIEMKDLTFRQIDDIKNTPSLRGLEE